MPEEKALKVKAFSYDVIKKTLEEFLEEKGDCKLRISFILFMMKAGEFFGSSSVQPE